MDNKCVTCGKPIDPTWNVCPSCGIQIRKLRLCPGCNRELEENWKSCPYCEAVIVETIGPPVSIKDSVVKELHQTQQTNVHEAKGATVGGSININVGMDPNGPRSSGSPEFQYEQYLMAILQSGGSLERVRTQLDQQRLLLGLSLKQSLDIENLCLIKTNRDMPSPQNKTEAQKHSPAGNMPSGKNNGKTSSHKKLTWIVAGSVFLVGIIIAVILMVNHQPYSPSLPVQAYTPDNTNTAPAVTQQPTTPTGFAQDPQISPTQNALS